MSCQAVTARRHADVAEGRGKRRDRDPSDERVERENEGEECAEEEHAGEVVKVEGGMNGWMDGWTGPREGEALYAGGQVEVAWIVQTIRLWREQCAEARVSDSFPYRRAGSRERSAGRSEIPGERTLLPMACE